MLKLNEDKTEFIILCSQQQLAKLSDMPLRIGNTTVLPVDYVYNLGFFLNRLLKNSNHVNRLKLGSSINLETSVGYDQESLISLHRLLFKC